MEKITFRELIEAVSEKSGHSKAFSSVLLKELSGIIEEGLLRDDHVTIKGLGTFRLRWVEPRIGRNPQTGETIEIPGHNRVVFRPEKSLREFINRQYAHLKPKILDEVPKRAPESELEEPIGIGAQEEPVITHLPGGEKRERSPIYNRWYIWAAAVIIIVAIGLYQLFKSQNVNQLKMGEEKKITEERIANEQLVASEAKKSYQAGEKGTEIFATDANDDIEARDTVEMQKHRVTSGDNLWGLAGHYYQNSFYWPNIYRVNQGLKNPDILLPAIYLDIPMLEGTPGSLSRQDSAHLAEGFFLSYRTYKNLKKANAVDYLRVARTFNSDVIEDHIDQIELADLNTIH